MVKTPTRSWDVVEHLETEEDMAAYLEAALEDGDPALIAAALGDNCPRQRYDANRTRDRSGTRKPRQSPLPWGQS